MKSKGYPVSRAAFNEKQRLNHIGVYLLVPIAFLWDGLTEYLHG